MQRFFIIITILLLASCAKKDDNMFVGKYTLEKNLYIEFDKTGKIIKEEWNKIEVNSSLIIRGDNTFEITYTKKGEGSTSEKGTHNERERILYINNVAIPYHYEDQYLVLVTEDYGNNKSLAYFKKTQY